MRYSNPELSRTVSCQSRLPSVAAAIAANFSMQATVPASYCYSAELVADSVVKAADTK